MRSVVRFVRGVSRFPIGWRLWVMLLGVANFVAPLFFLGRLEARVVLVTMIASAVLMMILTGLAGFSRLLGLGHILWVPLLIWLIPRLGTIPTDDTYGIWLRLLVAINGISLVIDAVDVARWIAGDRQEVVGDQPSATSR